MAIGTDRSVEPLSTTITSPPRPELASHSRALETQMPTVASSLRQGMTTDTRVATCAWLARSAGDVGSTSRSMARLTMLVAVATPGATRNSRGAGRQRMRWVGRAFTPWVDRLRALPVVVWEDVAVTQVRWQRVH